MCVSANMGRHFARIFRDFAQMFRGFVQIFDKSEFWKGVCTPCTPASYTLTMVIAFRECVAKFFQ